MAVTGIAPIMPTIDQQYAMVGVPQVTEPLQGVEPESVEVGMVEAVQVSVMDNSTTEDVASRLIEDMAEMTGVGRNMDVTA